MTKRLLLCAACCVLSVVARADDEPSGLYRVHVTKKQGAPPVVEKQPIMTNSGGGDGSRVLDVIGALLSPDRDSSQTSARDSSRDSKQDWSQEPKGNAGFGFEGGPAFIWLRTTLTTSFKTPNAPGVAWDDPINPAVLGGHGSLLLEDDVNDHGGIAIGLEVASFNQHHWAHRQSSANGIYANERVDVQGSFTALWMRIYPAEWLFVSGTLGLAHYTVNTRVETNAPSFEYDGVSGDRDVGLAGLGAGLSTPLRYHLAATVDGRWIFGGSGSSRIENGAAVVTANLKYRF